MCCVFQTLSTQWLQILKLFGVVFPKYKKMTSADLGIQSLKICAWIPLTMVKSLLLKSALLEIKIPAQLLIVHMQVQYWTKFGIHLQFAESTYICGFRLQFAESIYSCGIPITICGIHLQLRNPEQLAIFACCGIRNKKNVPTKFTLQVYVCGFHWNFVCGIHLYFGTYFKAYLWNIQTQNCAPIPCTVWPRNEFFFNFKIQIYI